jgi:hypothetical protein
LHAQGSHQFAVPLMRGVIRFSASRCGIVRLRARRENEMLAFEVTVNGKRRYVAGHPDEHSLHLTLWGNNRFERGASINTFVAVPNDSPGGLATLSYKPERIAIGDELTIRIVDVESPDPPVERNDGDGGYQIEFGVSP